MKKTILFFALITSTLFFSQMKVSEVKPSDESTIIGKVGPMGQIHSTLRKYSDGSYCLSYQDLKFTQIISYKDFCFKDIDNTYENLYNVLISGFEKLPENEIKIEFPNDIIYVKFTKLMGVTSVQLYHFVNKNPQVVGLTPYYTKKQVMKLFGKTEKAKAED